MAPGESPGTRYPGPECTRKEDIKHCWMVYTTIMGCLLQELFPEPNAILYLMIMDQQQFVAEFNKLILEALVGTEVNYQNLGMASMREELAGLSATRQTLELCHPTC